MTTSVRLPVITDATFAAEVLASDLPVLVDFTADWCAPCRMVTPVLEQLAVEEAHRLRVVTMDYDANPATARAYNVLSLPTMALFRSGEMVARVVGASPRTAILRQLAPYLA